jgi:hypothetical protein
MQLDMQQPSPEPTLNLAHYVRTQISEETARVCTAQFGMSLRALVLTGSLARDEATWEQDAGFWKLLGDADFFLVFQDGVPTPSDLTVKTTASAVEAALRLKHIAADIGLAAVKGSYFQQLPAHIATYELRNCGRVIAGEQGILSLVPVFQAAEISLEDAWRMLANRIIELLEAVVESGDPQSAEARYCSVKLFLDMATSYLVFNGRYLPTYGERAGALRQMAAQASCCDAPFCLSDFADVVTACTKFKIESGPCPWGDAALFDEAVQYAEGLWRWELSRLTGTRFDCPNSELMERWMALQPLTCRLRGWASLLRRSGGLRSWRLWQGWIKLLGASPRYWVYLGATEVFFRLPRLVEHGANSTIPAATWEGLSRTMVGVASFPNHIGPPEWSVAARMATESYRRFLEDTGA